MKKFLLCAFIGAASFINVQGFQVGGQKPVGSRSIEPSIFTNAAIATAAGCGAWACFNGMYALGELTCLRNNAQHGTVTDCSDPKNHVPTLSAGGLLLPFGACLIVSTYYTCEVGSVMLPYAWNRLRNKKEQ